MLVQYGLVHVYHKKYQIIKLLFTPLDLSDHKVTVTPLDLSDHKVTVTPLDLSDHKVTVYSTRPISS